MAITRKPDSKAEKASDRKRGIKPGSAADKAQDATMGYRGGGKVPFGGKRANPFAKKGKGGSKAPPFGKASKNIFGK